MTKAVQSTYFQKWTGSRIEDIFSANQALNDVIEIVEVATVAATGQVDITLPDTTSVEIINGKKVWVYDGANNAGTNVIRIIPKAGDGSTIQGKTEYFIDEDDGQVFFEILNNVWMIKANTATAPFGGFYIMENVTSTTISVINTYVDIAGIGVAFPLNKFTFSGNILTYIGEEDVNIFVNVGVTLSRPTGASARDYRVTLFKDSGAGYVEQTGVSSISSITQVRRALSFNGIVPLSKGDKLKLQVRNETTVDDITVDDLTVGATKI